MHLVWDPKKKYRLEAILGDILLNYSHINYGWMLLDFITYLDISLLKIGEIRVVVDWIGIGIRKESNIIMIEHNFDIL